MTLQVQYRPGTFKNFVGNAEVVESLRKVLSRKKQPSSYLITGPSGCGKTTLGRIIARALKCSRSSFVEMDNADDRSIESIRALKDKLKFSPLSGSKKVYLLDECHALPKLSQEALLKSLEEAPPYVHFILCTTNPEKLLGTLKRRPHAYQLSPLRSGELRKLMWSILRNEKIEEYPQATLDKIIELSEGSAGKALKFLDMVIDMPDAEKAIRVLKSAGGDESEVIEICRALVNDKLKAKTKWLKITKLLKDFEGDGESARRPILAYLEKVLLGTGDMQIAFMMEYFVNNFYDSGKSGLTLACYKAVFDGEE